MIALKIQVNGELLFVVGQEDISILHCNVVISRDNEERGVNDYIRLNTSGLSQHTSQGYPVHFRWKTRDLELGDSVEIEIIETDAIDAPVKRYRSDQEVQDSPFSDDELREMRYQDYLEMKKEFEPHTTD